MKRTQALTVSTIPNARELGGYITKNGSLVKPRMLLRSGALNLLSQEDQRILTESYKLGIVVDFRDRREIEKSPDLLPDGARYSHLPVIGDVENNPAAKAAAGVQPSPNMFSTSGFSEFLESLGGCEGIKDFMTDTYRGIAEGEDSVKAYKSFFEALLDNGERGEALLFHCTAGKDRTGIGAVLLLTALGVGKEIIVKDYMLTNQYLDKDFTMGMEIPEDLRSQAAPLLGVNEEYLAAYYKTVEDSYGSLGRYLNQVIGLKDDGKELLRHFYTVSDV